MTLGPIARTALIKVPRMDVRLPTHLIVNALIRRVQGEGGFVTVLASGERDAGTLLVVLTEGGANSRVYERMPQADGTRSWVLSRQENSDDKREFSEYLTRRSEQDPDVWVVELDIRNGERFILDDPA